MSHNLKEKKEMKKMMKKDIERMRRLFDKRTIGDKGSKTILRVMFGKDIPPTHSKNIILVLDRIIHNWVKYEFKEE
jgi:hypothetical protein